MSFWCFLFQMLFRGICSLMLKLSTNSRQLLPAPKKKIKRTIEPLHPATQHHRVPPPRNHPTQLVHTKTTTQHRRLHGKKTCMASKHEKCKMQQHSENSFQELGNSTEIVKKNQTLHKGLFKMLSRFTLPGLRVVCGWRCRRWTQWVVIGWQIWWCCG